MLRIIEATFNEGIDVSDHQRLVIGAILLILLLVGIGALDAVERYIQRSKGDDQRQDPDH